MTYIEKCFAEFRKEIIEQCAKVAENNEADSTAEKIRRLLDEDRP